MRVLLILVGFFLVFANAYETNYRIGFQKLDGKEENLLIAPAVNLSITEICGDVYQRKILFPTETTSKYNVVLVQSPVYYDLPPSVRVNNNDRLFVSGKYVGELELGDVISKTPQKIVFEKKNFEQITIPYDLGTKDFKLIKDCKYTLRYESVYKIMLDGLAKLQEEMSYQIIQEAGLSGVLYADLQTILAKVGELQLVVDGLNEDIITEEGIHAQLLLKKTNHMLAIANLKTSIETKEGQLKDVSMIELDIAEKTDSINRIDNEIRLKQEEIDILINNYNIRKAELESQANILMTIIEDIATEDELKEVMSQVIVPAIIEKQKYSVEHLKGNIVPSKLIHIDE